MNEMPGKIDCGAICDGFMTFAAVLLVVWPAVSSIHAA